MFESIKSYLTNAMTGAKHQIAAAFNGAATFGGKVWHHVKGKSEQVCGVVQDFFQDKVLPIPKAITRTVMDGAATVVQKAKHAVNDRAADYAYQVMFDHFKTKLVKPLLTFFLIALGVIASFLTLVVAFVNSLMKKREDKRPVEVVVNTKNEERAAKERRQAHDLPRPVGVPDGQATFSVQPTSPGLVTQQPNTLFAAKHIKVIIQLQQAPLECPNCKSG